MAKLRVFARQAVSLVQKQHRCYSAPTDGSIPTAKAKYVPTEGTYPKGFVVGSAHAGVKPSNTKFNDLALIASETLCEAAGVFTINAFKAAPVQVSKRTLYQTRGKGIRGVVINSGCANAVTGTGGVEDAIAMAREAGRCFSKDESEKSTGSDGADSESSQTPPQASPGSEGASGDALQGKGIQANRMMVMSTGVIGQRLPIDRIMSRIPDLYKSLGGSHESWLGAAKAICTTDTFPKLISRKFVLPSTGETEYCIAGMTKGAGMIHPNMATLLSVICTDAKVHHLALSTALREATNKSFNSISIDGDTSTNDTVNLFANGAAAPDDAAPIRAEVTSEVNQNGHKKYLPKSAEHQTKDYLEFVRVLTKFMEDLAKLVVRDGEGATKFVTIRVEGSVSNAAAKSVGNSIACSPLVKTALYGKDANWGRILCAVGYSPARQSIISRFTSVSFVPADGSAELKLLTRGEPENVDEERAKTILEMEDLEILVKLNDVGEEKSQAAAIAKKNKGSAVMWTCDFSHEYVTINGDYRT